MSCIFQQFSFAWMTAACVCPKPRTMVFCFSPFLQKHFSLFVKNKYGKRPMQMGAVAMCFYFFHRSYFIVVFINKNNLFHGKTITFRDKKLLFPHAFLVYLCIHNLYS